jgi:transposase
MAGVVVIGIDPHKGSHTAVALDERERQLGQLRVRASSSQVDGLLEWAGRWPARRWAIEGARGLGYLLAQQLAVAGERVLDVPPKLTARVRLLNTGQINKTDDNDARSVAIAALRGHDLAELAVEDQTVVMRVWARRYHDLSRLRTQLVCRLHAVLCELMPGGMRRHLHAGQAITALDHIIAETPIAQAKLELARELITDLQRIDAQRRDARRRAAQAVAASGTSITSINGVGPIIAATALGYVRDIARFPTGSRLTTAPHPSRSLPATGRSTGCPGGGTGNSTTPCTWPRCPRSGTATARAGPTTNTRSTKAWGTRRHCALSNAGSATRSTTR